MTWIISSDLEGYYFILLCHILDLNKGMLAILVNCSILWAISCKCFLFFQQIQSMTPCHECQKPSRDPPIAFLRSSMRTSYISVLQKIDGKLLVQKVCTYFPDKSVTWTNVSLKEAKICATAKICSPSLA